MHQPRLGGMANTVPLISAGQGHGVYLGEYLRAGNKCQAVVSHKTGGRLYGQRGSRCSIQRARKQRVQECYSTP